MSVETQPDVHCRPTGGVGISSSRPSSLPDDLGGTARILGYDSTTSLLTGLSQLYVNSHVFELSSQLQLKIYSRPLGNLGK